MSVTRPVVDRQREPTRSLDQAWCSGQAGLLAWEGGAVVLITLAGLALRLAFLGEKSLWLDEAITYRIALLDPAHIWQLQLEPHPPLFNLFMHLWVRLGQSEFMLRLPAALFGALTLPVLHGLSRKVVGASGALLTTALLAVSPWHIWFSQDARMYVMVTWLAVLAAFCGWRAVQGSAWGYWVGATLATLAAIYTDYIAIVWLWVVNLVFLALARRHRQLRPQLKTWALVHLALAIGYLPWMPMLLQHARGFIPAQLALYALPLLRLLRLTAAPAHWEMLLAVAGLVALLGLVFAWRRGAEVVRWLWRQRWLEPGLLFAFVLSLAVVLLPRGYFVKKEALIGLPFALVGVAWAMMRFRKAGVVAAAGLAFSLAVSLYVIRSIPKEDWRGAATLIQTQQAAGDAIVLYPGWINSAFDYYYEGEAQRVELNQGTAQFDDATVDEDTRRLWFVQYVPPPPAPSDPLASWLDARYMLLLSTDLYRVRIRLYEVK